MAGLNWPRYEITEAFRADIEALRPVLEETEVQAEQERRMPERAIDALKSLELFRLASPRETGGAEASPVLEFEAYEAVSRISSAAGWTTFVNSLHTGWVLSHVSDEAIEAMFAGGEAPIVAGQLAPMGRARVVEGGIRVTGKYSWGSGINHASWAMGAMFIGEPEEGTPPVMYAWTAPKSQVELLDNWYVAGLSGSGSQDFRVDDLFIPDGYFFPYVDPVTYRGGQHYSAPLLLQVVPAHSGFALGVAERAIGLIAEVAATKRRQLSTGTVADRGAFQRDLGFAYHRLAAARAYIVDLLSGLNDVDWSDTELVADLATTYVGALTYATEVAADTAQFAYKYAGGSAARLDHPLQRVLRDIQVGQQHTAVADTSYDGTGRWAIDRVAAPAPMPAGVKG